MVRGVGRRQAPKEFLDNCDAFMYIDPANRYELLDNEGLVRLRQKVSRLEHSCRENAEITTPERLGVSRYRISGLCN